MPIPTESAQELLLAWTGSGSQLFIEGNGALLIGPSDDLLMSFDMLPGDIWRSYWPSGALIAEGRLTATLRALDIYIPEGGQDNARLQTQGVALLAG